ncbi:Uncharacterised protein [Mobiluncus mulieris]|nr:Uncharacterised protein [Mobiluncus mulieris]
MASSISGSVIGDKVTIYNENGESFELTVTALLHDSVHEGYFIDWSMLSHFPKFAKSKNTETMVFARGITPQMSQDIAKSVNSEVKVLTSMAMLSTCKICGTYLLLEVMSACSVSYLS